MTGKAAQQVKAFKTKYEKRFRATARQAVEETARLAQRVEEEGGTMRVDTGFLRASIQAAVGQMPYGADANIETPDGQEQHWPEGSTVSGSDISLVLLRWDPIKKLPLFVGWTASYARPREFHDGFMRAATMQWDRTVQEAAAKVREGIV